MIIDSGTGPGVGTHGFDDRAGQTLQPQAGLPLKSEHMDPQFWAKLTALWHRERMREAYIATGVNPAKARHRANREALDIAHKHGWSGELPQFKAELAELIVNELPGRGKVRPGFGVRFWEERIQRDLMRVLAYPAERIEPELGRYLRQEVETNGRFAGRTGLYKLTHIVGFTPTTEHMAKRDAFLRVLNEIGNDREYADLEIYRVVLRLLQAYTHRPFETRLGEPMPTRGPRPRDRPRKMFGFLPFRSS